MEEKSWAYHLLEEVKKDAIEKARGKEVTEQVYSAMIQMIKLQDLARKEGILALELDIEEENLEPELDSIPVILKGIGYICNGMEIRKVAEILTTMYRVKNPQGMEALAYYICISGIAKIPEGIPTYELEALFTALLPEECAAEYEKRKEDRLPKQAEKTKMEIFLEKDVDLPRRSIIIRNAVEEKLESAKETAIKAAIQKSEGLLAIVLRGISNAYKKKLLFSLSPIRRAAVLEEEEYMGPIRTIDIENAFIEFMEYIEQAEKSSADMIEGKL